MPPNDVDALVDQAERVLARDGKIPLAKLGPKAIRTDVAKRLAALGFEVGKSRVERPAIDRVRAVLADGAYVPLSALRARVPGLSAAQAKAVVRDLARAGEAHVVLRTSKETLVPGSAPVVADAAIAALARVVSELHDTLRAATKKRARLLRGDVDAVVARLTAALGDASASPVLDAITAETDASTGLAFVPRVVARVAPMPAPAAHAELLALARAGLVELRPEGGLARLSTEERAACVPGPSGVLLSWVRRTEVA